MEVPDLNNIPAKGAVVGLLAATTVIGVLAAVDPKLAGIAMFGMLLMALATAKFVWIRGLLRKRKAQSMSSELNKQSSETPTALSDRPQIEKLDSLRKTFQGGLDKFKAAGKDLYKLPWYVVVGEPGAGKTEVIRHCDVGFPPGMQEEEFQGVGGTINMNWWFTNRAVILDTAGRLLFEKVPAGSTSEWKEFLKLLQKHRPNCPINGLLLAIPADSLVKDNEKKIQERAGWIARQLDTIQRELDIRFPVYVIITKCDLLNGFREFFEEIDDPDAQRQMLGWSNPEAIDKPFQPELVVQHLYMVVARLREIRLGLLEDPVARDASHRRIDEVARPYAFPHSISLIAENLRRYLSTIFVAGEWSARPLFLRGIYFTSSLQEGSELDQELAQAIGLSVEELPSGGAWKRETTLFLRDLFLEKIFREWGLVTRATDTRRLMRRRLLAVLGTAALALAAVGLFSWLGYQSMKDSIGRQSGYWLRASEGWSVNNTWMPIVSDTNGSCVYHGGEPVGQGKRTETRDLFDGPGKSLVDFHATLRMLTEEPLHVSPVFRPFYRLMQNFDEERKWAQRVVLEGSVIKPLLDATRNKMVTTDSASTGPEADRESEALISLIKIEAGIVKRHNSVASIAPANPVIAPLVAYTAGEQVEYNAIMPDVISWTYSAGNGKGKWPADWMNGGATLKQNTGADKIAYNQAIDFGLEHFRKNCTGRFLALRSRLALIQEFLSFLQKKYEKQELALWQAKTSPPPDDPLLTKLYDDFVEKDVKPLDSLLVRADEIQLFSGGHISLLDAYQRLQSDWKKQSDTLTSSIDDLIKELAVAETKGTGSSLLLAEILERLTNIQKEVKIGNLSDLDDKVLKQLDTTYLMGPDSKRLAYKERADAYTLCYHTSLKEAPSGPWIGTKFRNIEAVKLAIDQARRSVYAYQGESAQEFRGLCDYWLAYAQRRQIDACWKAYLAEARQSLGGTLHFPIVWPPEDATALSEKAVLGASDLIATIHADLQSKVYTETAEGDAKTPARIALEQFTKNMGLVERQLKALVIPEEKRIARCRISMPRGPVRPEVISPPLDPVTKLPISKSTADLAYELRLGTYNSKTEHKSLSKKVTVGMPLLMIDRLPLSMIFHAHCWYGTGSHDFSEVKLGGNWVVLRILNDKKGASSDGIHWLVNMAEPEGDYPLNQDIYLDIEFYERPVPLIPAWPRKEMILQDE